MYIAGSTLGENSRDLHCCGCALSGKDVVDGKLVCELNT